MCGLALITRSLRLPDEGKERSNRDSAEIHGESRGLAQLFRKATEAERALARIGLDTLRDPRKGREDLAELGRTLKDLADLTKGTGIPTHLELRVLSQLLRMPIDLIRVLLTEPGTDRGQKTPLVLYPGILAPSDYLIGAKLYFERHDYTVFLADLGPLRFNIEYSHVQLERFERQLEWIFNNHGPVTLVGHSRGGHSAVLLSLRRPELLRMDPVAVMSPLTPDAEVSVPIKVIVVAAHLLNLGVHGKGAELEKEILETFRGEFRAISIRATRDGAIDSKSSIVRNGENYEVDLPHLGPFFDLGFLRSLEERIRPKPPQASLEVVRSA